MTTADLQIGMKFSRKSLKQTDCTIKRLTKNRAFISDGVHSHKHNINRVTMISCPKKWIIEYIESGDWKLIK